jgi:hypothetical protein
MARASKVEACMICWDTPCSCNAKPSKTKTPRAPRAPKIEPAPEHPKPDLRAAMKSAASPIAVSLPRKEEPIPTDSDFTKAVVVLDMYDMLAPEEKEKYALILNDPKLRAQLWKERRNSA